MADNEIDCPFCSVEAANLVAQAESAYAISDGYPVSPGHTLVVPRRHVRTLFELPRHEMLALWDLVRDDPRFSFYGRYVSVLGDQDESLDWLMSLARLGVAASDFIGLACSDPETFKRGSITK